MATPAVTAWDANGNPVARSSGGVTAWDANGNPVPHAGTATPDVVGRPTQVGRGAGRMAIDIPSQDVQATAGETANTMKNLAVGVGSAVAPGLAPEAGVLAHAALTALGAGSGTVAGQAITGQNPLTSQSLKETGINAGVGAGSDLALSGIANALISKVARRAVNESVGAAARDVTYGNPAKALLNEGIANPATGDLEAYKAAVRTGSTPDQAMLSAGGRAAAVQSRISLLQPALDNILSQAPGKIPASTVTNVIDQGIKGIQANHGITAPDAQAAIAELNEVKQAALKITGVPGAAATAWSPLQANTVKQEIGANVNWTGRERIGEIVEPIRKQVYGALKDAVNAAAPGAADLNERLSDLYAARGDIQKLMQTEEVGQGRGALGSSVTGIARRLEAMAGRLVPGAAVINQGAQQIVPPVATALSSSLNPPVQVSGVPSGASIGDILRAKGAKIPTAKPNQAGEPFSPGAGVSR